MFAITYFDEIVMCRIAYDQVSKTPESISEVFEGRV